MNCSNKIRAPYIVLGIALLTGGHVRAGGPLAVEGSSGHSPVHYSPSTITINYDIGMLGSRTNSQADGLVLQAFNLWNNVSTATVQLSQGTDLFADIDSTNYFDLIPDGTQNHPSSSDHLNPMVYDHDGLIIEDNKTK